ncbi:glycosyl transferase [Methanoculleus sp. FWC-SCC1]|uniref:Glycosyl transferase n=1 Tax=Methanoculleus frigidifontis TaxID=2584085 RepID=A0ABT8M6G9_9EURY|nr:glycosyltransferase family 39 protein [Methanoculleus sp. FWC-SCC1]MDN7023533.1 glycosyl transferase [Methanoculleus sp. FWC-SCC1]
MDTKQGKQAESTVAPASTLCETETIAAANTLPERIVALLRGCVYMRLLTVLTAVGLLLRCYHPGYNPLWPGEGQTLHFAGQSLAGIWASMAGGEFAPPLFSGMENVMLLFGESEFVLRFIPALLGVLTIPIMYFVGATFRDKNTGIIAAALMTFSPFHIFYAQEAWAYAPMLFFFALSLPFYIKALRTDDLGSWVIFGILGSLAFWTHFYAFFPIGLLLLFAAASKIQAVRQNPMTLRNPAIGALAFAIAVTAEPFVVRTAAATTYGMQSLPVISQTLLKVSWYSELVLAFFLILFAVGLWFIWRETRKGAALIAGMIVLPLIVSALLAGSMPMMPHHLICLLPFWFVGIAASNQALVGALGTKKTIYAFIAVIALINIPFYASYYPGF